MKKKILINDRKRTKSEQLTLKLYLQEMRMSLDDVYTTTLPFLFEYTGENESAFTRQSEWADLVQNNIEHMPGL